MSSANYKLNKQITCTYSVNDSNILLVADEQYNDMYIRGDHAFGLCLRSEM